MQKGKAEETLRLRPIEAIVLAHVAHKVKKSKNERDGLKWYYQTVEKLAERFPWIPPKTLGSILRQLAKMGCIIRGNYNRLPGDRTVWYAMSQDWLDRAAQKLIYFRVEDAVRWGLCEAVLLQNLAHWLKKNPAKNQAGAGHPMRPRLLSTVLPFSEATIKRALSDLQRAGALEKTRDDVKKCSCYRLSGDLQDRIPPVNNGPSPVAPAEEPELPEPVTEGDFLKLVEANRETLRKLAWPQEEVRELALRFAAEVELTLKECGESQVARILQSGSSGSASPEQGLAVALHYPHPDSGEILPFYFEVFVHTVNRNQKFGPLPRSHDFFVQEGYQGMCRLGKWIADWKDAQKAEAFRKRQQDNASVDAEKETMEYLSPAEKASVLRNGINARNRCGRLTDGKIVKDYLSCSKGDLNTAETFFKSNRQWTPAHVLDLLDRCSQEESEAEEAGHDPLFHTRRGFRLRFLLRNLEAILQELSLTGSMPTVLLWRAESDPKQDGTLPEKGAGSNQKPEGSN